MSDKSTRLARTLTSLGIKFDELGELSGVHPEAISGYCEGTYDPGNRLYTAVPEVLGVSGNWLWLGLGGDADSTPMGPSDKSGRAMSETRHPVTLRLLQVWSAYKYSDEKNARLSGISVELYNAFRRGELPDLPRCKHIAEMFGYRPEWLIEGDEPALVVVPRESDAERYRVIKIMSVLSEHLGGLENLYRKETVNRQSITRWLIDGYAPPHQVCGPEDWTHGLLIDGNSPLTMQDKVLNRKTRFAEFVIEGDSKAEVKPIAHPDILNCGLEIIADLRIHAGSIHDGQSEPLLRILERAEQLLRRELSHTPPFLEVRSKDYNPPASGHSSHT